MDILVSVIIPVYNLEDYIGHCLQSMLNQTYSNIEIICVDDGSTDRSADIINSFKEKDRRVFYLYQENAGVSAARNNGLNAANGKYIMYVDGDDYMHNQAVEIMLESAEKHNADMVCSYQQVTTKLKEETQHIDNYVCQEADFKSIFTEKYGTVIGKSSCAKLIKKEIAKLSKFPVGFSNGEDGYFIIKLLNNNIRTFIIDEKLYYYYTRENSVVTSPFNVKKFSITILFDNLCECLKNSQNEFLKSYSLQYLYQTIFYNRTMAVGTEHEDYVLSECRRIGKKRIGELKADKGINRKLKIMFIGFFYSRHLYELARLITDPTMAAFYKSRKHRKAEK